MRRTGLARGQGMKLAASSAPKARKVFVSHPRAGRRALLGIQATRLPCAKWPFWWVIFREQTWVTSRERRRIDGHRGAVANGFQVYFSSSPAASGPRHTREYVQAQGSAPEIPEPAIFLRGDALRGGDGIFGNPLWPGVGIIGAWFAAGMWIYSRTRLLGARKSSYAGHGTRRIGRGRRGDHEHRWTRIAGHAFAVLPRADGGQAARPRRNRRTPEGGRQEARGENRGAAAGCSGLPIDVGSVIARWQTRGDCGPRWE